MSKTELSFQSVVAVLLVFSFCMGMRLCNARKDRFFGFQHKYNVVDHTPLNHSNHYFNKSPPPVKSIKSPDGDIIDCVHILRQPAFNHPFLKNHTIKMRPTFHPNEIKYDDIETPSIVNTLKVETSSPKKHKKIIQLWHNSNEKCPKGTIPVRRTKNATVYVKGYRPEDSVNGVYGPPLHEHAFATTVDGQYYGGKATFNLWTPKVQEDSEFSLAHIWVLQDHYSVLNTVEAGWQVAPSIYGDRQTRLFVYWTGDGYQNTGCYNHLCFGFIQTNNEIALGGSISPTSEVDGSQYEITIFVWKDPNEGQWWLQFNDEIVGYWPTSIVPYLSQSASLVQWGGEIVNLASGGQHTSTQMGSGRFPTQGFKKASYVKNIQIVNEYANLNIPEELTPVARLNGCYDIQFAPYDDNWGFHFFLVVLVVIRIVSERI